MKSSVVDTIVAISTPVGEGGIGIVRLSGKESLPVADKIFRSKDGKVPSKLKSFTTHYGHILDGSRSGSDIIDEVILTIMRSPRSYTKEDIVEINCHGGIVPLRKVMELVLSFDVRLAEPGEFTKRAFLNGRIDLAQAESVLDIIKAKTDRSLHAAMGQLEGELSSQIRKLRNRLLDLASHIEVSIDFPDEDVESFSGFDLEVCIKEIIGTLNDLVESAERGVVLRDGVRTVICGRPNVGKSSLMNSLLRQKKVIVSHIPGTTRDAIEDIINIDGIPLKIVDTAGIIDTDDHLTKEGVAKSRFHVKSADLILFLLDGSEPLSVSDRKIMEEVKDKKVIVVVNKTDLPKKLDLDKVRKILHDKNIIEISVVKRKNLRMLEEAISGMVWGGQVSRDQTNLVTNVRHKTLLLRARNNLKKTLKDCKKKLPPEIISLEVRDAIDDLGEITGETIDTEILNRIFNKFCIGK